MKSLFSKLTLKTVATGFCIAIALLFATNARAQQITLTGPPTVTNADCLNGNNTGIDGQLEFNVTGGDGSGYNYALFSTNSICNAILGPQFAGVGVTDFTIPNLVPGSYYIVIWDGDDMTAEFGGDGNAYNTQCNGNNDAFTVNQDFFGDNGSQPTPSISNASGSPYCAIVNANNLGSNPVYQAQSSPYPGTYTYNWAIDPSSSISGTIMSTGIFEPTVQWNEGGNGMNGELDVTVTDDNGCSASASISNTIGGGETLSISPSNSAPFCVGSTDNNFTATSDIFFNSYNWSTDNGAALTNGSNNNSSNQGIDFNSENPSADVYLTVTDGVGCQTSAISTFNITGCAISAGFSSTPNQPTSPCSTDGSFSISVSSGGDGSGYETLVTGTTGYSNTQSGTNNSFTGLGPDTYTITVYDADQGPGDPLGTSFSTTLTAQNSVCQVAFSVVSTYLPQPSPFNASNPCSSDGSIIIVVTSGGDGTNNFVATTTNTSTNTVYTGATTTTNPDTVVISGLPAGMFGQANYSPITVADAANPLDGSSLTQNITTTIHVNNNFCPSPINAVVANNNTDAFTTCSSDGSIQINVTPFTGDATNNFRGIAYSSTIDGGFVSDTSQPSFGETSFSIGGLPAGTYDHFLIFDAANPNDGEAEFFASTTTVEPFENFCPVSVSIQPDSTAASTSCSTDGSITFVLSGGDGTSNYGIAAFNDNFYEQKYYFSGSSGGSNTITMSGLPYGYYSTIFAYDYAYNSYYQSNPYSNLFLNNPSGDPAIAQLSADYTLGYTAICPIVASIDTTLTDCNTNSGTITVTVTGGGGGYNFGNFNVTLNNNNATTQGIYNSTLPDSVTFTNLAAGNYSVSVSDADMPNDGAAFFATTAVTSHTFGDDGANPAPTIAPNLTTNNSGGFPYPCTSSAGYAEEYYISNPASYPNNYTYQWTTTDPSASVAQPTGANTSVTWYNGTGVQDLSLVVTDDNGCTASSTIGLIIDDVAPVITPTSPTCAGSANNVYTTQSGLSSYSWSVTGGSVTAGGTSTDNTATITWGAAGAADIDITITDAQGCTTNAVVPITIDTIPVLTISGPTTICAGTSNVYTTQSGASNYSWTPSFGGTVTAGGSSNDPTVKFSLSGGGGLQLNCNYTDGNGCTAVSPVNLPISVNSCTPIVFTAMVLSNEMNSCNNTGQIYITVTSGGLNNGTYYFIVSGYNETNGMTYVENQFFGNDRNIDFIDLPAGVYDLTVSDYLNPNDGNASTQIAAVTILPSNAPCPMPITATVTSSTSAKYTCSNDGTITITATGGNGNNNYEAVIGSIGAYAYSNFTNTMTFTGLNVNTYYDIQVIDYGVSDGYGTTLDDTTITIGSVYNGCPINAQEFQYSAASTPCSHDGSVTIQAINGDGTNNYVAYAYLNGSSTPYDSSFATGSNYIYFTSDLPGGNYIFKVFDAASPNGADSLAVPFPANGTNSSFSYTLYNYPVSCDIVVNATPSNLTGCNTGDGQIAVNPTGGDGSNIYDIYLYNSVPALVTSQQAVPNFDFMGLNPDTYSVLVYDADADPLNSLPDDGYGTTQSGLVVNNSCGPPLTVTITNTGNNTGCGFSDSPFNGFITGTVTGETCGDPIVVNCNCGLPNQSVANGGTFNFTGIQSAGSFFGPPAITITATDDCGDGEGSSAPQTIDDNSQCSLLNVFVASDAADNTGCTGYNGIITGSVQGGFYTPANTIITVSCNLCGAADQSLPLSGGYPNGIGTLTYTFTGVMPGTWDITASDAIGDIPASSAGDGFDQMVTINNQPGTELPTPTITPATAVCAGSAGNVYTTESGQSNYAWTISGQTSYTGGTANDNTITVTWGGAGTGDLKVNYTDSVGCTAAIPTDQPITITSCGPITWTGGGNPTNWLDPLNWTGGTPTGTCSDNLVINPATNEPDLTSSENVGDITLTSGASITIERSVNLNVCDNITGGSGATDGDVLGAGELILNGTGPSPQQISGKVEVQAIEIDNTSGVQMQSGSVLDIYSELDLVLGQFDASNGTTTLKSTSVTQAAIINNFSNTYQGTYKGSVVAERFYAAPTTTNSYNQHEMGSPVSAPALSQFGASGTPGYVTDANCDGTKLDNSSPYGTVFGYDETHGTTCGIEQWKVLTSGNAVNGAGYSIRSGGPGTLSLSGAPNIIGNVTINGTNSGWANSTLQGYPEQSGWTLASNPYPATLNISSTSLENNVGAGWDGVGVMVWNTTGGSAGSYQLTTTIAPFQAFMVHITEAGTQSSPTSATYTIYAGDRVTAAGTFFKEATVSTLNITATNQSTGLIDVTTVGFNQNATSGFDPNFDVHKIAGDPDRHTLYTLSNSNWMCQNINQSIEQTPTVPMGFSPGVSGTYTLNFDGVNSFDATSYITLEDTKLNAFHDVRSSAYTFAANTGDNWNRFVLHFTPPAVINATNATCSSQGMINVIQPGTANWNYTIADINNTILSSGILNQGSPLTASVAAGVYTITLVDNNGYSVIKTVQVNGSPAITANFNPVTTAPVNDEVTFTSNSSGATSNVWNFGDGATGSGITTTHTYTASGVYNVTLMASNAAGCSATSSRSITITSRNVTGISNIADNSITIWSNDNKVYVDFTKAGPVDATVTLYNIIGQQISQEKFTNNAVYTKEVGNIEAGYVIVNAKNGDDVVTRKVFIVSNK